MSMRTRQSQVDVREVTFIEISARSSGEWCRLLLEESTGMVQLISSCGTYSYQWASIGERTLAQFLAGCDSDYLGRKFLGTEIRVPDETESAKFIRERVVEMRRSGELSSDEAREEYELAKELGHGGISWDEWCCDTNLGDAWEYRMTKINPQWVRFWELLWEPMVRPVLKNHHR